MRINNRTRTNHFHDIIECLIAALEAKDLYTSGHSNRVADMSLDLALVMGLKSIELENVHIAAHLHDIGKMGVPEIILHKKEKLTPNEWAQIQMHSEIGYNILSKSKELSNIAQIVLYHHERWDGSGYPKGLQMHEIPLGSRIIGVADAIDAMTSIRPYRKAMTWDACWEEIQKNKGIQFDPTVVDTAERLWSKWKQSSQEEQSINTGGLSYGEERALGKAVR